MKRLTKCANEQFDTDYLQEYAYDVNFSMDKNEIEVNVFGTKNIQLTEEAQFDIGFTIQKKLKEKIINVVKNWVQNTFATVLTNRLSANVELSSVTTKDKSDLLICFTCDSKDYNEEKIKSIIDEEIENIVNNRTISTLYYSKLTKELDLNNQAEIFTSFIVDNSYIEQY